MMTVDEKKSLLETYAKGPQMVEETLASMPAEALHFRPSEDAWTVAEHLNHLLDSEAHAFVRYRAAVAQPGAPVAVYDEEIWDRRLGYDMQYYRSSLDAFALLRRITGDHLASLVEEDWSGYFYSHPEQGKVTLEKWLEIYSDHVQFHLNFISRNLRLFAEKRAAV